MDTFFELGKDQAAKGEGWASPFISCAQDTVGLPLPVRLLGYGKPLPLLLVKSSSTKKIRYLLTKCEELLHCKSSLHFFGRKR